MQGLLCVPRPSVNATHRGVTLRYLLELLDQGLVDRSWTIQDVVDKFVRPKTVATRCCLFDVVPSRHSDRPQYFVSHTWSRKYADLMQMLKTHFKVGFWASEERNEEAADVVLWLDIIAINQHPYVDKVSLLNEDVANLANVVRDTQRTLLCLDEKCTSLSRIWCLFEVWCTFLTKGAPGLLVLMPDVKSGTLTDLFKTFDVENAKATKDVDRVRILNEISQAEGGATEVNLQLKRALVDSARYEADHSAASGNDKVRILMKAGEIHRASGQYKDAEAFFRQAHASLTRVLGDGHRSTITCVSSVALCLKHRGLYAEAEPMYRQVLAYRTRVLGADHPDTITIANNLAALLGAQGKYAEAEPMFRQVLADRARMLGGNDAGTIASVNNLAVCLKCMGELHEAEPRQALAGRTRVLGANNPDTIANVNNLAICLAAQGKHAEAEPMYRQALADSTRVLGTDHPSTIASVNNLAICLDDQGKRAEAEAGRTCVLGADYASTSVWASGKCKSTFTDEEEDGEDKELISMCELPKVKHWCTLPTRHAITTLHHHHHHQ